MTLKKKGEYWYGTTVEDTETEMIRFSKQNTYVATRFMQSRCNCGSIIFKLESDETEGAARHICVGCGSIHLMGDSAEYADDADFDNSVCICDHDEFQLLSGVALYEDSNDVRWYYIGCLCDNCQLTSVFAHYKCEAGDADVFLANV